MAVGEIVMYDGGTDPVSSFTITGLEPSAGYYIYAVITNGEYDSATEVSASIGVVAAAGI